MQCHGPALQTIPFIKCSASYATVRLKIELRLRNLLKTYDLGCVLATSHSPLWKRVALKVPVGSLSGVVLCRFFRGLVVLDLGKLLLARVLDSMCSDLVHGDGCLVMLSGFRAYPSRPEPFARS